ncbi:pantoate--beta-alanine ligase [soil metagenome]
MIIFKQKKDLSKALLNLKAQGKTIGFIPTMGALHEGHLSLIKVSKSEGNITVASIFINPTQFNDKKDFEKYPITIEKDIYLLEQSGTDILFLPSVNDMYPEGLQPVSSYALGFLETTLEGYYRPGHFQGVCRIVHKFLKIVAPRHLYMGQKDYQQCMVIQKLINDFALPVTLNIVETRREESGLAMSSRNLRLSQEAKPKAAAIYKAHLFVKYNLLKLPLQELQTQAEAIITSAGFEKTDYVAICDAVSLTPLTVYDDQSKLVILSAAYLEGVRLIDNLLLN